METELKSVNILIHRFLTNEIVTELDIKKSLKIRDDEMAQIIGKTVCNNNNFDELIKLNEKERLEILADSEILTAVDYNETKM
jgi:hypothetical protein